MLSIIARTGRHYRVWRGALVAPVLAAVLVAACGGGDVVTSGAESREGVREILALVQAGDVDDARQRFDEPHRLLHATASNLAASEPELSQGLDSATEDLQRELLRSEVDPAAVSEVIGRLLGLLAQTGEG